MKTKNFFLVESYTFSLPNFFFFITITPVSSSSKALKFLLKSTRLIFFSYTAMDHAVLLNFLPAPIFLRDTFIPLSTPV